MEVILLEAVLRLCELTVTPKAVRLKAAIKKQFLGQ